MGTGVTDATSGRTLRLGPDRDPARAARALADGRALLMGDLPNGVTEIALDWTDCQILDCATLQVMVAVEQEARRQGKMLKTLRGSPAPERWLIRGGLGPDWPAGEVREQAA